VVNQSVSGQGRGVDVGLKRLLPPGTPGTLAGVDFDAAIGEDAADVVLELGDVLVEAFPVFGDRSLLTHFDLGDVHGNKGVEHRHLGEFQCVVSVRFPLGVLPGPGLLVGAANDGG